MRADVYYPPTLPLPWPRQGGAWDHRRCGAFHRRAVPWAKRGFSLAIRKAFLWLDEVKLGSCLALSTFACLCKLFTAFKNALRALRKAFLYPLARHSCGLVPARLCEIRMAV